MPERGTYTVDVYPETSLCAGAPNVAFGTPADGECEYSGPLGGQFWGNVFNGSTAYICLVPGDAGLESCTALLGVVASQLGGGVVDPSYGADVP